MRGQTGPERHYTGFGNQGAALAGLVAITGWPDRAPAGPWGAYTDFITPRYGVAALTAALIHRDATGRGQYIDLSQIEAGIQFQAPLVLDYAINGRIATAQGNASRVCVPARHVCDARRSALHRDRRRHRGAVGRARAAGAVFGRSRARCARSTHAWRSANCSKQNSRRGAPTTTRSNWRRGCRRPACRAIRCCDRPTSTRIHNCGTANSSSRSTIPSWDPRRTTGRRRCSRERRPGCAAQRRCWDNTATACGACWMACGIDLAECSATRDVRHRSISGSDRF